MSGEGLADMLAGPAQMACMDAEEFDRYWVALGTAVRLASLAAVKAEPAGDPGHQELSCVSASTERAPAFDHDSRRPVTVNRIGFGRTP